MYARLTQERVNGVIWYLLGVIVSLHLFPEDIASISVVILSWSDTCASMFGRLYGRYTPSMPPPLFARRKSVAGFAAAVLSSTLVVWLFWGTSIGVRGERPSGLSWTPTGAATFGTPLAPGPYHTGWLGLRHGFVSHASASWVAKLGERMHETPRSIPPYLLYTSVGLLAGVVEAMDLGGMDDNLSIPILSGFGIWAILWGWGRYACSV